MKKKCRHCGKFNEYDALVISIDETMRDDLIDILKECVKRLEKADIK